MSSEIPRFYTEKQVNDVLNWPLVNEAVEEALKAVSHHCVGDSAAQVHQPQRMLTQCGGKENLLFTMPGYIENYKLSATKRIDESNKKEASKATKSNHSTLACKLVTSFANNEQRQPKLNTIMATILLFSTETGQLNCILEGTQITAWRTAAASIIATKYLYFQRFPDCTGYNRPINVAIIGCGVQGESHALDMCATFNVQKIFLWNRTHEKAQNLSEKLLNVAKEVIVCTSIENAVAEADVICTCTYTANPLLNAKMIKKDIVHINAVGAGQQHYSEIAQDLYDLAQVYVDS